MNTNNCKLDDLMDVLEELYDKDLPCVSYELKVPDRYDAIVSVDGIRIIVPTLKLSLRFGDFLVYDDEEDDYNADYSMTLLYDENEKDVANYIAGDGQAAIILLYNYLHQHNLDYSMEQLEVMDCIIELEEQK